MPDLATLQRLADTGDPFWKGALWMYQETQNPPQD